MTGATATARGTRNACPVGGCRRTVIDREHMCLRHWRLVPRELQQRVRRATPGGEEYREAIDAAVHAAESAEGGT